MRIALVLNSLIAHGGVERRAVDFFRYLKDQGHEPRLIVLRKAEHVEDFLSDEADAVEVIRSYRMVDGRIKPLVGGLLRLRKRLRSFDAVFGLVSPSHYFARLALWPRGRRTFIAMERLTYHDRREKLALIDRKLPSLVDRWVAVSEMLREAFLEGTDLPPEVITTIEDGVAIAPPSPEFDVLEEHFRGDGFVNIGYLGSLSKRKRPRLLLDALALLAERPGLPEWRAIFVGGVDDETGLQDHARDLGIVERVVFAGETAAPHDFYRVFDVFAFPSVVEGLGNTWMEAMLHGLPVVSSDLRPMADYLRDGENALLVPPDDAPALADALERLLRDQALAAALGDRAKADATARFTLDMTFGRLLNMAIPAKKKISG